MNAKEYREVYLRSPHWLRVRRDALERAEYRCQVCNANKTLDVHHRTYERLGNEAPADLTVLCRRCHERFHDSLPRIGPKPQRAPKMAKALSKRQRRVQRKRDGKPGAHAKAMADMKARNEGRA
jgi:5-methylcytosine-specific restriction endonuclease McrA